jgi:DNA-binding transcriptional LysR family regulator
MRRSGSATNTDADSEEEASWCAPPQSNDSQRVGDGCRSSPARPATSGYATDRRGARGSQSNPRATCRAAAHLCTRLAAAAVIAPIWDRFLSTYPEIQLEVALGEAAMDIVSKGFDAGTDTRARVPTDDIYPCHRSNEDRGRCFTSLFCTAIASPDT